MTKTLTKEIKAMIRKTRARTALWVACGVCLLPLRTVSAQTAQEWEVFYSVEEDFVTQGPVPGDGNPIISGGDLISSNAGLYMRNAELTAVFKATVDLGLDAVDVIDKEQRLVAFSTELAWDTFGPGDLLMTNGVIIPNQALMGAFDHPERLNLGLDSIHFAGTQEGVLAFVQFAQRQAADYWLSSRTALAEALKQYEVDLWFSTEGTGAPLEKPSFIDGDLLSAATGTIVSPNSTLMPTGSPAGIPLEGVDFGLDAVTTPRSDPSTILFSTEIRYDDKGVTDGHVLLISTGVVIKNEDFIILLEPPVRDLGLDAISWMGVIPEFPIVRAAYWGIY